MLFRWGQPWINHEYTDAQLILFGIGCFGWVIAYAFTWRQIITSKFVEIPWGAVVANIAWEFVWGFIFGSDMGFLFTLGYALWCVQDLYITWSLFKYGRQQLNSAVIARYFTPATAAAIVAWGVMIYFFVAGGYDTGYGANSGYILNVMMSALYIDLVLRHDVRKFSAVVAWSKGLGTALLSVFNFMVKPDMPFLLTLCVITGILDAIYIAAFYARRRAAAHAAPTAAAVSPLAGATA